MRQVVFVMCLAGLSAGCAPGGKVSEPPPEDAVASSGQIRPVARPSGARAGVKPPALARTVAQFDTTTQAEKTAAAQEAKAAQASGAGKLLGRTVASLGDPTDPGLWIKTPLVSVAGQGRVVYPVNGKAVQVDLIPIDGPKTAGSRMSLAALRVIKAPLAGLPEVEVYSQ